MKQDESLGLEYTAGGNHYRAFVGPPEDYDLVAAMVFNLLTCLGLRQNQRVLDIGCGSLRVGRLLIPFLNQGGYTGLEPNEWLIRKGIESEIGDDQIRIKQPRFIVGDSYNTLTIKESYDFIFAQSIFSHTGQDLLNQWLHNIRQLLSSTGIFLFTYVPSAVDALENGWIYPHCIGYKWTSLQAFFADADLAITPLAWAHPRQAWALAVQKNQPFPSNPNWENAVRLAYPNWQAPSLL